MPNITKPAMTTGGEAVEDHYRWIHADGVNSRGCLRSQNRSEETEHAGNGKQGGACESHQETDQPQPPHTFRFGNVKRRETKKDQHIGDHGHSVRSNQPQLGLEDGDRGLLRGVQCCRHDQQQATHGQGHPAPANESNR